MKGQISLEMIAYLVLGVFGLIMLLIFLTSTVPFISQITESLLAGIRQTICNLLHPAIKTIFGWIFGC